MASFVASAGDFAKVPDLMNDPFFATNGPSTEKGADEADTCRICRGEGTKDEPLFYPCKCSGSIKFVHQDCLMEWLSHSQKKHCELCKTPFRFTKLYHPHMPKELPTSIFLRRATVHILRHLLTWCRGLLVGSVWLLLLPWCMRVVWRCLFWVGDGCWGTDIQAGFDAKNTKHQALMNQSLYSKEGNISHDRHLDDILVRNTGSWARFMNGTVEAPTALSLLWRFFGIGSSRLNGQPGANSTEVPMENRSSLLSDVSFFKSVSHSPAVNGVIIDVLEGQIITLLVVVAFILIFLIREWVVQQQPVINLAALNGDNIGRADVPEPQPVAAEEPEVVENLDTEEFWDQRNRNDPIFGDGSSAILQEPLQDPEANDESVGLRYSNQVSHPLQPTNTELEQEIIGLLPEEMQLAFHLGDSSHFSEVIRNMPQEEVSNLQQRLLTFRESLVASTNEDDGEREISQIALSHVQEQPFGMFGKVLDIETRQRNQLLDLTERSETDRDLSGSLYSIISSRERSSIATEIPRNVEKEGLKDDQQDSGEVSLDPERHSDLSIESWQQVTENDATDVPLQSQWTDCKNKGKAKATTTSDDDLFPPESASLQSVIEPPFPIDYTPFRTDSPIPHLNIRPPLPLPHQRYGFGLNDEDKSRFSFQEQTLSMRDSQDTGTSNITSSEFFQPPAIKTPLKSDARDDEMSSTKSGPTTQGEIQFTPESSLNTPSSPSEASQAPVRQEPMDESQTRNVDRVPQPPPGMWAQLLDWIWADIGPTDEVNVEEGQQDDEVVLVDLDDEAPFIPFEHAQPINAPQVGRDDMVQDPEVAAAAAQAGIDLNDPDAQDAIDDAEDLEGILELIGMQGPLTGLIQNAIFSAILISTTVAAAVWIPYLFGKVVLLFMGSPISLFFKIPLRILSAIADLIVDICLYIGGSLLYWPLMVHRWALTLLRFSESRFMSTHFDKIIASTGSVAKGASGRIASVLVDVVNVNPDFLHLSVRSHTALRTIKAQIAWTFKLAAGFIASIYLKASKTAPTEILMVAMVAISEALQTCCAYLSNKFMAVVLAFSKAKSLKITLDVANSTLPVDPSAEYWTPGDRVIAIIAGYTFFAVAGALYLSRGSPFTTSPGGRRVEGVISDILQQAGGVLKVILIISIEMLVFPLYCGLLLDLALLPLFTNATVQSRVKFMVNSPWIAGFVHWFIGTCYMFHFALFVSMCRKIMRSGVLYFIRDPDDPTFHPVRDVLERNVTTQLRKIAFSALVYGALVVVCLGGVVWSLYYSTTGILPIRWASTQPVVEFPLDLLFYNFLTPFIIKLIKPSDGLHTMYQWWFRKCARFLRLSDFLFGEKQKDEEGRHVRRTWVGWFRGKRGDVNRPVLGEDRKIPADDRETEAYFLWDGKYVRAPASDQVRIPKGDPVFLEVDHENNRLDGHPENQGLHAKNSSITTMVYIPPWFRLRIGLFVLAIWVFAAATGLGVTVAPLLWGRYFFSFFIPSHIRLNDIYAFSFGIYSLGASLYCCFHAHHAWNYLCNSTATQSLASAVSTIGSALHRSVLRIARVIYVYGGLGLLIPIIFAALTELYLLIPLHTYIGPREPHVIHIIQDWTLGFLYARIAARILFWDRQSRPARALRAVVRDGYLDPNARLATRCFILPITISFFIAAILPGLLAEAITRTYLKSTSPDQKVLIFRFAYPVVMMLVLSAWLTSSIVKATRRWRAKIKDEVYLIGERLHNFGERRPAGGIVPPIRAEE